MQNCNRLWMQAAALGELDMVAVGSELIGLEVEREPSLRFLLSQVAEARSAKEAAGQVRVALEFQGLLASCVDWNGC